MVGGINVLYKFLLIPILTITRCKLICTKNCIQPKSIYVNKYLNNNKKITYV